VSKKEDKPRGHRQIRRFFVALLRFRSTVSIGDQSALQQDQEGHSTMTDRKTLPANIAWLSTCILSAAAGHQIDDFSETTWLLAGMFGILAAVGLEVASRTLNRRAE